MTNGGEGIKIWGGEGNLLRGDFSRWEEMKEFSAVGWGSGALGKP